MSRAAPPLLEVDLGPGVRAAFTSRSVRPSGVSLHARSEPRGPGDPRDPDLGDHGDGRGFNLSLFLGDDAADVLRRREALRRWAGAPVAYARQVHGSVVHRVVRPPDPLRLDDPVAEADALVTTGTGCAVAVLVADCVPVLLADAGRGVVAAVHAGRRGLVSGVVEAAVQEMVQLGARTGAVRAVVGPAICGACYEVPGDLRDEVDAVVPGTATTTTWGTPGLDLPGGVVRSLRAAGVQDVAHVGTCTFTDDRWYSHRASGAAGRAEGRFAGVVRLTPVPASVSQG